MSSGVCSLLTTERDAGPTVSTFPFGGSCLTLSQMTAGEMKKYEIKVVRASK